ncbi:MAG: DNA mismatch repair protein MutS [Chloracidobacterium sp.]|nr:DNA mismatch repair protein MutS [Chloracidobacterium sp.]MCO5332682.1 DNA mismatch repair protein MutS [Pyrinomonadaceae bacterium]
MEKVTPMLRQYLEIKKLYPGCILFFRLGDFYEMFNEDAIVGSRELEITLTARQKDTPNPVPMCGVPHHAAANYIARLVRKGYRVAICEQAEEAGKGVKLVKREVVRVITPGTAIDPQLVEPREPVYLAAISGSGDSFGAAFLDVSSANFVSMEESGRGSWDKVMEQMNSFDPREILFPRRLENMVVAAFGRGSGDLPFNAPNTGGDARVLTPLDDDRFAFEDAERLLRSQFAVADLKAFGLGGRKEAVTAAGACLSYAHETQKSSAAHITSVEYLAADEIMIVDAVSLKNLEILETRGESPKRTLFGVLDNCVTSMGSRLLRQWLLRPSLKRSEIQTRLAAVTELSDTIFREQIRVLLKGVSDIERLTGRLNLGTATPRDLTALCGSLSQVPQIHNTLADVNALLLQVLSENIFELPEITELISRAIEDDAPNNLADGGVIREGFDSELDELRQVLSGGKQTIASFEARERERTGIGNLKIKFNSVFGYYIEVSKAQLDRVPADYERRQTVANAERYTTPQLKEWEQKVLSAEERIVKLEAELFHRVRSEVCSETKKLQITARALATLDVLCSLAFAASANNYVCPTLNDGDAIEIERGRHPIVETFGSGSFIPNDIVMNNSTDRLLIITGANMGGKSTILRQVALIQVMAQIGSFVPAAAARLPIIDRIWTRVGASDDLASGRSTFMVEMTETAEILHNATPRSLILLDEIGRGTSTFDGLSIAWAVAEYLHNSPEHSAKTLFATHYHELTELAENLPGAKNYQITAEEKDGEVVFLHKLQPGKASKSYGIAVARLAGLPLPVVERAKEVLKKLERYELAVFADDKRNGLAKAAGRHAASQVSLFAVANESAIDAIREVEVDVISADEAKQLLAEIKQKLV